MSQSIPVCEACDSLMKPWYNLSPVSREQHMYACPDCGFKQVFPPLQPEYWERFYRHEQRDEDWRAKNRALSADYYARLRPLIQTLLSSHSTVHVLEVGGGYGFFSGLLAQRHGQAIRVEMVEPNATAAHFAAAHFSTVTVHATVLEDFQPQHHFDWIFLGHVLEHAPSAIGHLRRLRDLLKDAGYLTIVTPNGDAFWFSLFGKYWRWATLDQHNMFVTPQSLRYLAQRLGLRILYIGTTIPHRAHYPSLFVSLFYYAKFKHLESRQAVEAVTPGRALDSLPETQALSGIRGLAERAMGLERTLAYPLNWLLSRQMRGDELVATLRKGQREEAS